jgi:hypothetical protein
MAYRRAVSAEIAEFHISRFDLFAFIADFLVIQEITAAIIAAKADAVGNILVFIIAEWTSDKFPVDSFIENCYHFGQRDFFYSAPAGADIIAIHQTDINSGSLAAGLVTLATAAIGHPEAIVRESQLPRLLVGADKMNRDIVTHSESPILSD